MASQIELPDDFVYYFGLYLIKKEEGKDSASKFIEILTKWNKTWRPASFQDQKIFIIPVLTLMFTLCKQYLNVV